MLRSSSYFISVLKTITYSIIICDFDNYTYMKICQFFNIIIHFANSYSFLSTYLMNTVVQSVKIS